MDVDYPRALLLALGAAVAVAVVVAGSTSGAAFGPYNPAWDGAADLRGVADDAGTEVHVVRNASGFAGTPADGTVAVVLAPETRYRPGEAARLRTFVRAGGTLLVADDRGGAVNPLLSAVGARARVDGASLRDEQHYHRAPSLPVAAGVADHPYTRGVDALTLNHGTVVRANGATPLVNTSAVAYLDADGDGTLDADETVGPYPVATVEPVGDGRVVVVADASAFINVMLEQPGNRAFAAAVLGAHDRALLDVSHAGPLPPLAAGLLAVRGSPGLGLAVGLLVVGAVGLWARRPALGGGAGRLRRLEGRLPGATRSRDVEPAAADPDALAARLRARHPGWDAARVERVVAQVRRRRRGEDDRRRDSP